MEENKISLKAAQMQRLARYEITFRDFFADAPIRTGDITCQEAYSFTLEDLYAAMKALKAADPTVEDFGKYWFYPINRLSDDFDLERACGDLDDFDDVPEEMKGYPGPELLRGGDEGLYSLL